MSQYPYDEDNGPGSTRAEDSADRDALNTDGVTGSAGFGGTGSSDTTPDMGNVAADGVVVEDDLDSLLAVAHRERDEYLGMVQRVQADFENYKKRMQRQQSELVERAAESLVLKLLPVLDALDLARAHMGEGDAVSAEGKALVQASSLLSDTLAKDGLERVDDVDVEFDPTTHEAVEHDPAEGGDSGTVSAVLRSGYRWKGRVIRPAMVRVRG